MHNPRHDDMPPCYEDLVAPSGVTSGAAAALASVHALLSAAVALASTARSISRREKKGQCVQGLFFYLGLRHWHARNLSSSMPPTQGHVGLGDAVLRRGAVAGAIQRSATVFTPVVPASWLELALHVVAGQRSAMMHS